MGYQVGDIVQIDVFFTVNNTRGTMQRHTVTLTVEDPGGYSNGDIILIAGAGPGNTDLVTEVLSVSDNVITTTDQAAATVTNTTVGEAADPATVTFDVTAPSGAVTSFSGGSGVVNDGPGQYHVNYTAAESGVHYWEAHGTTTATGTISGYFDVEPSPFSSLSPRALCSLGEVKQLIGNVSGADDAANLIAAINGASAQIHREAGREFVARNAVRNPTTGVVTVAADARRFPINRTLIDGRLLFVGDIAATSWGTGMSAAELTIATVATESGTPVALVADDLGFQPASRDPDEPITRIAIPTTVGLVSGWQLEVTAIWGFPRVPDDIREAAKRLAAGNFLRDVRRWTPSLDETAQDLPRTMIGNALRTARGYRTTPPIIALQVG